MKKGIALLTVLLLVCALPVAADTAVPDASVPYASYVYDLDAKPVSIPAPYAPDRVLHGPDLGLEELRDIRDIYYDAPTQKIYVCDSGNNRILILNTEFQLQSVLQSFTNNGAEDTFSEPAGVFTQNGKLYISDSRHSRIVCLQQDTLALERVFERPAISLLEEDYLYTPGRLVVDSAGRMYVAAEGINQGLLQLDENGDFSSFMGAPDVHLDFFEILWRTFATEEQRNNMIKAVPTEYTSIAEDDKGFIFATSMSEGVAPISKLNGQGENVIRFADETPSGDGVYMDRDGELLTSKFVDIAVRADGTYFALDTSRSRIFAYDPTGTLLYAFAGAGTQQGTTYSPTSVEIIGNRLVVSDKTNGTLTLYRRTAFGQDVDEALAAYRRGENEASMAAWRTVLETAPQYTPGILFHSRQLIQNGQAEQALRQLKSVGEKTHASQAYRELRSLYVRENFYWLIPTVILGLAALMVAIMVCKKLPALQRLAQRPLVQQLRYAAYVSVHPFDGFWDLKREKRGGKVSAGILYGLFFVVYAARIQFSGYLFTDGQGASPSLLPELLKIALPLFLWCVSGWCLTTLMDGKGTATDIAVSTGYALTPYILMGVPLLVLSHVLTLEELAIYQALDTITIVWVLTLLVFSAMMTHDYSLGKTLVTVVLIIVGILLILFIALLFLNLIQNVISYGQEIWQEITFRMY